MTVRIIPRLDIKGPNLVKGMHLEGLRVLGRPDEFAQQYYEAGADELLYIDAVASLYQRNSLLPLIERTARDICVPLTVGGGLRSVDDIRAVLRAGGDKAAINTAALRRPEFITEAARLFGSSTIVVSIEAIRRPGGGWECFTDCGRERTGVDAVDWARTAERLGAGELLVTSVDREGTGKGFDLELTRSIAAQASIPVIACGGAGRLDDVWQVVDQGRADAVAIASLLHYDLLGRLQPGGHDVAGEGNREFLRRGGGFSRVQGASLSQVKQHLAGRGVPCRAAA